MTASEGGFRSIDRSKNFRSPPLPFLPQSKRFRNSVFFAAKPPAHDSLAANAFWSGVRFTSISQT